MITELARLPLAFQPGSRWHYSLGIDVAAHLIEVIADQPLGSFLQERLFGPLGMVDTAFCVPADKRDRLAIMYGLVDGLAPDMCLSRLADAWGSSSYQRLDVSGTYPSSAPDRFARGGHGLYSTAWDYMRFAQMLLNQGSLDGARILGRKTASLMRMNHLPARLLPFEMGGMPETGYGFGLGTRVLLDVAESGGPG